MILLSQFQKLTTNGFHNESRLCYYPSTNVNYIRNCKAE